MKTKGKATTINSTTTKPAEICQAFASTMVNQFLRWRHNSFLCLFIGFRNAFVEVEMILTMPDFWCKKVNKWRLGERWFFEKKKDAWIAQYEDSYITPSIWKDGSQQIKHNEIGQHVLTNLAHTHTQLSTRFLIHVLDLGKEEHKRFEWNMVRTSPLSRFLED